MIFLTFEMHETYARAHGCRRGSGGGGCMMNRGYVRVVPVVCIVGTVLQGLAPAILRESRREKWSIVGYTCETSIEHYFHWPQKCIKPS